MKFWNQPCQIPAEALYLLALCPTLAVCDTFWNGLLLSVATAFVCALAFGVMYLLREVVQGVTRFVALLVTASTLAGIAALLIETYFPAQFEHVGAYVPLIALQCIALDYIARPQEQPAKLVHPAAWYALTLCALGLLREFLGAGTLFGLSVLPPDMEAIAFFQTVPGAFASLAFLLIAAKAAGLPLNETGEEAKK